MAQTALGDDCPEKLTLDFHFTQQGYAMTALYRILPMVLSVGIFGCSNSTPETPTTETKTTETTTAQNTLPDSAPIVKMATDPNFAPYDFKDEYGNMAGFDIELMEKIAADQGFKLEKFNDQWEVIFDNLDDKKRDIIAAAVPYSAERASKYLLSDPYAPLPSTILYVDKDITINSLDDLNDINLGVLINTVQLDYFTSGQVPVKEVTSYATAFAAVQAMAQGKIDAVAEDAGALRYLMRGIPQLTPKYFDYEDIRSEAAFKVLVIDKDQPELLEKVNAGLKNLKQDGTYAALTEKWFGEDLTADVLSQEDMPMAQ